MPYIQVKKDGLLYETECFYEDDMVTVLEIKGGQSSVDLSRVTETAAAYTVLRSLIKENKVGPLSE